MTEGDVRVSIIRNMIHEYMTGKAYIGEGFLRLLLIVCGEEVGDVSGLEQG